MYERKRASEMGKRVGLVRIAVANESLRLTCSGRLHGNVQVLEIGGSGK